MTSHNVLDGVEEFLEPFRGVPVDKIVSQPPDQFGEQLLHFNSEVVDILLLPIRHR